MANKVYGIDLGTTYSCIAHVDEHGKPAVIPNSDNELTTPSVVYFESSENIVVGSAAKDVSEVYPDQVVSTVKREMGNPDWVFEYEGKEYTPQEISSFILEKVVKDAQENIGEKIKDVVITVPAYFGVNEKEATKQAGELAGLNVLSIIPEPTAAAISYGIDTDNDEVVMVYDLGGGTFDITVIEVKDKSIRVISTDGDHQLGGKNWDERLANYFATVFEEETGIDSEELLSNMETWQELLNKAEDTKKKLTSKEKTIVRVAHDGEKATVELTREKFDELTNDLLERTISLTNNVLENIKEKGYEKIDKILLVGGSTYMPQVREKLSQTYGYDIEVHDPNQAVAKGAALYGWKLSLENEIKIEIAEKTGEKVENIQLGSVNKEILEEVTEEVVQKTGYALGGVKKLVETVIINVTSKSFGVIVLDENYEQKILNLIRVDDEVPTSISQTLPLAYDSENADLSCYENIERKGPNDELLELDTSKLIGEVILEFGTTLPAGSPIEVTFKLSEDGLLEVYGKDLTTLNEINASFKTESIISQEKLNELKEERENLNIS
jgi:molecular chaperone DnaK (HSP70)